MLEYFSALKPQVAAKINVWLDRCGQDYAVVSPELGADAAARLADFSSRGKMIRGCLVRLGYELASGKEASGADLEAVLSAGAAMELFQSGLLVHDDIMDRDRIRRGAPTLHVTYETSLAGSGANEPEHHGMALGICAGDLAYFAAFQLLASLPVSDRAARQVGMVAARELSLVGVAQMQDVSNGAKRRHAGMSEAEKSPNGGVWLGSADEITEEDVIRLYRYKTGRYTFSLPLALGAAIAGAEPAVSQALEIAGEYLGILFQIKDDELGLYADAAELGKPIGADVREDKKTLFRLRLFKAAPPVDRERLGRLFGSSSVTKEDMVYLRTLIDSLGIRGELQALMREQVRLAEERLGSLLVRAPEQVRKAYHELASYSLERRS